jgi:hypothetical protein
MRLLLGSAVLLTSLASPGQEPKRDDPISSMQRFELQVVHWEGSFGTYSATGPGATLIVDLSKVGTRELTSVPWGTEGAFLHFDLAFLAPVSDVTEGDAQRGWSRRVVLAGRPEAEDPYRTVLDLLIQYEVEAHEVVGDRRVKQRANMTHLNFRLHSLRADDTIYEYGRARATQDRDLGVWLREPEPK